MRTTRRWTIAILVLVIALFAAACGGDDDAGEEETSEPTASETEEMTEEESETSTPSETADDESTGEGEVVEERAQGDAVAVDDSEASGIGEGMSIGIVAATMATEFHSSLNNTVKDYAESLGFEAEIFDSQEEAERQLRGIEGFIGAGVDAIIITGLGGETVGPVAQEAADAGIFVVQVAGRQLAEVGAVTVSVDDEAMGLALGQLASAWVEQNLADDDQVKVAITDFPDIPNVVIRADAIEESFTANAPDNVELVGRFKGGTAEFGLESMEAALQQHPDLQGVLGINDAGNLGAYQAFQNAGKLDEEGVFFFGIDCDPEAVELIEDPDEPYYGCVNTNPTGTGEIAVNAYVSFLLGREVPNTIEVPVGITTGPNFDPPAGLTEG